MRIINCLFLFLIFILINGSNGAIWRYLDSWKDSFGSIENNTKVLFSPNLYTSYSYKLESLADIVHNPQFNKSLPTVVYIHGYLGDGEFDESVMAVRSAYRNRNNQNFIAIDWSAFSHFTSSIPYLGNIDKLRLICEGIALQLELIRTQGCSCYKNFYLVGHSLGGQCAGLIGRHLKKISNNNFVISRIYALDPAGPGFETKNNVLLPKRYDCISKDDAEYVQIMHTNGNRYGVNSSVGHSDFYPNGGMNQPGCKDDSCSHQFAWIFYQQSVKGEAEFLARECDSYENFENGNCDSNEVSFMGYSSNGTLPMGTYFLRTHPNRFGTALGEEGLKRTSSYLIFEDGTKQNDTESYGFRSIHSNLVDPNIALFTNNIPQDRYNEMLRKQHLRRP